MTVTLLVGIATVLIIGFVGHFLEELLNVYENSEKAKSIMQFVVSFTMVVGAFYFIGYMVGYMVIYLLKF